VRISFVGAGGVGGFYGAMLARTGHDVSFIARGKHLDAIRQNGLRIVGPLGDFRVNVQASDNPADIGPVDAVVFTVKTYDNATAIPLIKPLVGPRTTVVTLQNGVDSAEEIAAVIDKKYVVGGCTYIATAIESPGVIRQTGTHRRVVLGEYFDAKRQVSGRVQALADAMLAADIQAEPVADARHAVWEKFTYLAPFAAFTGAARLPIGPLWAEEDSRKVFLDAVMEVAGVAKAHGASLPADHRDRVFEYATKLPPSTRSSLLIDLSQGKRIEVEALQGSVVRRGARVGVPTPIMAALYAVLRPHAGGAGVAG
jgi:2-dehydropantoate 2-reductase